MDRFINPVFLLKITKSYLFDLNRIFKANKKEIDHYQDKALRRVVKNAFSVPLYYDKYKNFGIQADDIKGIRDLKKLPFITKDDLRRYYPNGIIPKGFNKNKEFLMSTSGSTGKPVFIFCDRISSIKRLIANMRELKFYGGNWFKSRIALIIDLENGSVENTVFSQSIIPFLRHFLSMKNIRYFHIGEKADSLINELDQFNPEFIGTDPNMLRDLAFLKNQGLGQNVNPKNIISSGAMIDTYTKKYIQNSFNCRVFDVYGSTEAGSIAFECIEGNYHVNSDFAYLEFLDENDEPIDDGKPGRLIVTRLYNNGTPIIRYSGNEDYLTPIKNECKCGLKTQVIKQIEGRHTDMIILPNGRMFSPLNLTGIPAKIMEKYNTYKIKQFQIIQNTKDDIEVLVVIDKKLRNIGPDVKKILDEMQKMFQERIGNSMIIRIIEVEEIQKVKRSDYFKVVISKIKT
jgi:phenylacetate-CoA ligase